jgi:hypothetical protein
MEPVHFSAVIDEKIARLYTRVKTRILQPSARRHHHARLLDRHLRTAAIDLLRHSVSPMPLRFGRVASGYIDRRWPQARTLFRCG